VIGFNNYTDSFEGIDLFHLEIWKDGKKKQQNIPNFAKWGCYVIPKRELESIYIPKTVTLRNKMKLTCYIIF